MEIEPHYHKLNNKTGKAYALFMSAFFLLLIALVYYYSAVIAYYLLAIPTLMLLFFYKEIRYNKDLLVIHFPLRPIFRNYRISVGHISRIRFRAYGGGGKNYPFMGFTLKGFPFYNELRISNPEEVLSFFEVTAGNACYKARSVDRQNHFVISHLKEKGVSSTIKFTEE